MICQFTAKLVLLCRGWGSSLLEIDDAGWGDMLDGVVLGYLRTESGEFFSKIIDVKFFKEPYFKQKLYLDEAVRLTREILGELKVEKSEEIRICTAAVLEKVRETLSKEGYKVTPAKIIGELQFKVEGAFIDRLEELGVPKGAVPFEPGKERFYVQLRWIHGDLANREKYVKTAYKSWRRWRKWQPRHKPRKESHSRSECEEDWWRW
jgi:hypothetical protein